jgi:hypothetical protein
LNSQVQTEIRGIRNKLFQIQYAISESAIALRIIQKAIWKISCAI